MIVFAQGKVRGLTTGSSMWLAAGVGLACGLGEWAIAGLTAMLSLCIIVAIRKLERRAGTYDKEGAPEGEVQDGDEDRGARPDAL
jgi:putative Mg2+ transporter-C (MgtC) family protein